MTASHRYNRTQSQTHTRHDTRQPGRKEGGMFGHTYSNTHTHTHTHTPNNNRTDIKVGTLAWLVSSRRGPSEESRRSEVRQKNLGESRHPVNAVGAKHHNQRAEQTTNKQTRNDKETWDDPTGSSSSTSPLRDTFCL